MRMNSLITAILITRKNKIIKEVLLVLAGVVFLTLTAQVRIYLPFTPVPITGQTFGILLIGLVYGRKLGMSVVGTYIAAGTLGLPLFTGAGSGIVFFKPSGGYIIGYFFAVMICGYLAEKGWTKSYIKTLFVIVLNCDESIPAKGYNKKTNTGPTEIEIISNSNKSRFFKICFLTAFLSLTYLTLKITIRGKKYGTYIL